MTYHTPVLLQEVVEQLQPRRGGLYVDGTVGGGGHAAALLRASGPDGRLIGLDWDDEAISQARERLGEFEGRVQLVRANFAELERVLMNLDVPAVDGVLFDLGVSARQFDEPMRGFSFVRPGPLDMRMDRQSPTTAREIILTASELELTRIFLEYGEERRARAIARAVIRERERGGQFTTTTDLAQLVERVLGPKRGKIHPATRVFQALRIAVNRELESLPAGLVAAVRALRSGGRLAVISFHSLEDRIVKMFFREQSTGCVCPAGLPVCGCGRREVLRVVTRRPIVPSAEEIAINPRARSAKLRVAEKI
jgi:16S rRNA (cytosine1402-N4)-methyltransferase